MWKKLAGPRNECNANVAAFYCANGKRSQKSGGQATVQVKCGRAQREQDTEVGRETKERCPDTEVQKTMLVQRDVALSCFPQQNSNVTG